jgi:hypothetical protein
MAEPTWNVLKRRIRRRLKEASACGWLDSAAGEATSNRDSPVDIYYFGLNNLIEDR